MIDNCDIKIRIANTHEPSDYISAAQQAVDAILNSVKKPFKNSDMGFLKFN